MTLPQNQHDEAKFDRLEKRKKKTKWKTSAENVHNTQHDELGMGQRRAPELSSVLFTFSVGSVGYVNFRLEIN